MDTTLSQFGAWRPTPLAGARPLATLDGWSGRTAVRPSAPAAKATG